MEVKVQWIQEVQFKGISSSGHEVMMDGPPSHGGNEAGFRPMELLLVSLGGCSSFDVVSMLKKGRQPVEACVVDIKAERADAVPAVFTAIHLHFTVTGTGLNEKQVERAVQLSAEKYCSASIMLGKAGVQMTHSFEVRDPLKSV
jgi:putative redox protein